MKKIHGMTKRQWATLFKLMTTPEPGKSDILTVAEYIRANGPPVEYRTSKRGTRLVKVTYPNGTAKEYPVEHIDRTSAFII